MAKELVISAAPHETRVAILEDGLLCEIYIEREKEFALVGSIYKGRVTRVLPGMQSAFVDIGLDSDAFLYVGDFLENLEDYDHVVTAVEGKVEKMEQQGGAVFAPSGEGGAQPALAAAPASAPAPAAEPASAGSGGAVLPGETRAGGGHAQGGPVEPDLPPEEAGDQIGNRAEPPLSQRHSSPSGGPSGFTGQDRGGFGRDRDRGGRGDRGGDHGGDRGRRGRGRWRGGRDRGGDRRPGRDLPPSKYASSSSRPFAPRSSHVPHEPAGDETPAGYQPVILPGESLAKYKGRAPEAPSASHEAAPATGESTRDAGLPPSLYATPREPSVSGPVEPSSGDLAAAGESHEAFSHDEGLHDDHERAAPAEHDEHEGHEHEDDTDAHSAHAAPAHDLSDDEVSALAEQLAEARQEEITAEAAADAGPSLLEEDEPAPPESAAERDEFVADAEDQEHDDAMAADAEVDAETLEGDLAEKEADTEVEALAPEVEETVVPPEIGNLAAPPERPMSARIAEPHRARFQRPQRQGGGRRRGHRNFRSHDQRNQGGQRRPQLISEMLKAGQEILVQIAKEPLGKKGARITSHVALPGRFLVYMPTVNHVGVSRRIGSAEERQRLRRVVGESKGTFPGGFIVRTAAEGAPDDEIRSDVEFLGRTWEKIIAQSEPRKAPALLHRDLNLVERILRDYVSNDYTAIWIDNQDEYSKVVEFVGRFQPKLVSRVKLYTKPAPIFEEFGIQQELDKALRPKVWLKSGGYIVINHTEALVAIDVNTGKYVGRGSTRLEDTIVKTNLEAVKEIVRQIRLRDLGGIIVLDLIDMEERRNRDKVMAALESALRADRAPSKALSFNEFGLVTVTRKRTKQALERVLCQPCPYCTGSGMVKSVPTICYEIQAEARKMSPDLDSSSLTLRVHPEIAKALKTREAALIEELEQNTRKSVIIQADPTLHWEQYDIY